jgi:MFS transporter, DHA1 family, multidrug resistance protein
MSELFRDTVAGFFIRTITGKRFLRYPEEIPGFQPSKAILEEGSDGSVSKILDGKDTDDADRSSQDSEDVELGTPLGPNASRPIHPVVTKDGVILVDWYSDGRLLF